MSVRVSLRGMLRLIRVVNLRRVHNVGFFLVGRLIFITKITGVVKQTCVFCFCLSKPLFTLSECISSCYKINSTL